ncbi:MAG: helix-turn-helix transcriptional regulator [bacterium]|nr:helix-turn-helix transcriptional regulator [bacterium]
MNIKKLLGAKIRELRKQKKYSQEYFSELIELNPRQIVRIESGESFPTAENLEKIANALDIKVQELFINDCFASDEEMKEAILKKLTLLGGEKLKALYLMAINL